MRLTVLVNIVCVCLTKVNNAQVYVTRLNTTCVLTRLTFVLTGRFLFQYTAVFAIRKQAFHFTRINIVLRWLTVLAHAFQKWTFLVLALQEWASLGNTACITRLKSLAGKAYLFAISNCHRWLKLVSKREESC